MNAIFFVNSNLSPIFGLLELDFLWKVQGDFTNTLYLI